MEIKQLRRERFNELVEKMGGQSVFVEVTGYNQSLVSRIMLGKKSIGEKMARSIEMSAGWPHGSLDGAPQDPMEAIQAAIGRAPWMSTEDKAYFIKQIEWLRKKQSAQ